MVDQPISYVDRYSLIRCQNDLARWKANVDVALGKAGLDGGVNVGLIEELLGVALAAM